jgi:hypothetical protein
MAVRMTTPFVFGPLHEVSQPSHFPMDAAFQMDMASHLASMGPMVAWMSDSHGSVFSFTLRKADGLDLGADLVLEQNGLTILVEQVHPGGALDAWNEIHRRDYKLAGRVVESGDRIVCVNAVAYDATMMAEIIKTEKLLKLTFIRSSVVQALEPRVSIATQSQEFVTDVPPSECATTCPPMQQSEPQRSYHSI